MPNLEGLAIGQWAAGTLGTWEIDPVAVASVRIRLEPNPMRGGGPLASVPWTDTADKTGEALIGQLAGNAYELPEGVKLRVEALDGAGTILKTSSRVARTPTPTPTLQRPGATSAELPTSASLPDLIPEGRSTGIAAAAAMAAKVAPAGTQITIDVQHLLTLALLPTALLQRELEATRTGMLQSQGQIIGAADVMRRQVASGYDLASGMFEDTLGFAAKASRADADIELAETQAALANDRPPSKLEEGVKLLAEVRKTLTTAALGDKIKTQQKAQQKTQQAAPQAAQQQAQTTPQQAADAPEAPPEEQEDGVAAGLRAFLDGDVEAELAALVLKSQLSPAHFTKFQRLAAIIAPQQAQETP